MLVAVVIIVVGLVFVVIKASDSFNTWHGDSGFLKIPHTFTMNLFGFFDFMNLIFVFLFCSMFFVILTSNIIKEDIATILFLLLVVIMFGSLPFFHFYKKYLFYQLNGQYDYTFDPSNKTLAINDFDGTTIGEDDISKIISFNVESKLDFRFDIIYLKNSKEIVVSSDLPFHGHLFEFFGKNILYKHIEFSPLEIFNYLDLLNSYSNYSK
jgi:hypothetical protein